jgi:hypothetical protein
VCRNWWANFWGFTVEEYEIFLDIATQAIEHTEQEEK